MGKSKEQIEKESARKRRILDTAFRLFVEKKIEAVSMGDIASAAGTGRATLFRYYSNKMELVIAVGAARWKAYLDELDATRPISSLEEIPAIMRFTFTLDSYIDMYVNHKVLLQFNDNFNHFVSHAGTDSEMLNDFKSSLYSADARFLKMYEKAKEDHTFRTDIPFEEFMRETVHVMMAACTYYANGFIWGADEDENYVSELKRIKGMIVAYVRNGEP